MKMALQTQSLSSSSSSFNFSFNSTSNVQHTHLLIFSPIRSEKTSDSAPQKPGVGFGPSSNTKQKDKGRRRDIIRRNPVEKPAPFASSEQQQQQTVEQSQNERAFILAWLGFGAVILVEGIALAASGFLPEEWDKIFVKYVYPSFTPTVLLFLAGAVVYGVLKYLQNDNITQQK